MIFFNTWSNMTTDSYFMDVWSQKNKFERFSEFPNCQIWRAIKQPKPHKIYTGDKNMNLDILKRFVEANCSDFMPVQS